jgi:hypothetical protein
MVRREKKGLCLRTSGGHFDRVIQKIKAKGRNQLKNLSQFSQAYCKVLSYLSSLSNPVSSQYPLMFLNNKRLEEINMLIHGIFPI